jgi:hypothetical protein
LEFPRQVFTDWMGPKMKKAASIEAAFFMPKTSRKQSGIAVSCRPPQRPPAGSRGRMTTPAHPN